MRNNMMLRLTAISVLALSVAAHAADIGEAAKSALRAEKALGKNKLPAAITEAEAAVAAAPGDASYRMLLGRAYLESGRFRSAAASYSDALELDPSRGAAALSLALTRIGLGDKDGARAVLDEHGAIIPAADRGLALALAGNAPAGVALLEEAVRAGGATAKTRQNLALAYALAGRWPEAKLMASYDLDPQTVSGRIMEWSRMARDGGAPEQVATLLGVSPGDDAGQPERLALHVTPSAPVQMAEATPPPPVKMAEAPAVETIAAEAQAVFAPVQAGPRFAERTEVVQAIAGVERPVIVARPVAVAASRLPIKAFVQPTGGRFVVQIGAFDSIGVAQDAWGRAVRRVAGFDGLTPSTAVFVKGSTTFYRLSVGGFGTRATAVGFCEQFRARGGQCFVREQAGDAPLQWAKRPTRQQLASR